MLTRGLYTVDSTAINAVDDFVNYKNNYGIDNIGIKYFNADFKCFTRKVSHGIEKSLGKLLSELNIGKLEYINS